jgi:hypothetical protein
MSETAQASEQDVLGTHPDFEDATVVEGRVGYTRKDPARSCVFYVYAAPLDPGYVYPGGAHP